MKTQTSLFQLISKKDLQNLTEQVNETLATGYEKSKQFSSADLWNIQRQRKMVRLRRNA